MASVDPETASAPTRVARCAVEGASFLWVRGSRAATTRYHETDESIAAATRLLAGVIATTWVSTALLDSIDTQSGGASNRAGFCFAQTC